MSKLYGTLDTNAPADPVPGAMEPKAFQAELCAAIVDRLNAQYVRGQATRTKAAMDMLCGAMQALHMAKSEHYNGVSIIAMLTSARGVEIVEKTARGEPL